MAGIYHLGVGAGAQVGVVLEELLVTKVEQVALGVVQARVHVLIQLPVLLPQFHVKVWPPLAGELAVEDENIPLLLVLHTILWWGRQRSRGKESSQELIILSVLPVLCTNNMATVVLKLVPDINYSVNNGDC